MHILGPTNATSATKQVYWEQQVVLSTCSTIICTLPARERAASNKHRSYHEAIPRYHALPMQIATKTYHRNVRPFLGRCPTQAKKNNCTSPKTTSPVTKSQACLRRFATKNKIGTMSKRGFALMRVKRHPFMPAADVLPRHTTATIHKKQGCAMNIITSARKSELQSWCACADTDRRTPHWLHDEYKKSIKHGNRRKKTEWSKRNGPGQ